MTELTKDNRIKNEIDRLTSLLDSIDGNKRATLEPLIQNAGFMRATLEDLQQKINETGAVEVYQNGEHQHGLKQSAALQSYNALIKNYAAVIKVIALHVPPEERPAISAPVFTPIPKMTEEELLQAEENRAAEIRAAADVQKKQWSLERKSGKRVNWQTVRNWIDEGLSDDEMLELVNSGRN